MLEEIFKDKSINAKDKTLAIVKLLSIGKVKCNDLVKQSSNAKDPVLGSMIEAMEHITREKPEWLTAKGLELVITSMKHKAPRVRWESNRVIGNCAAYLGKNAPSAVKNLLENSEHEGTVVRWSAAFALGEIIKQKSKLNKELIPAIEAIIKREEKNSIRKIYQAALKKVSN